MKLFLKTKPKTPLFPLKRYAFPFGEKSKQPSEVQTNVQKQIQQSLDEQFDKNMSFLTEPKQSQRLDIQIPETIEKLDAPAVIDMNSQNSSLMTDNPLATDNYLQTNKDSLQTQEDLSIRLTENPALAKILAEGKFELSNPAIELKNSADSRLYFAEESDFKSFSLGNAPVLQKDQVYIEDVDPYNIPKNLDIAIFKEEKEFVVFGKSMGTDEENYGKDKTTFERLDQEAFVEKNLSDARKEEFNFFEQFILSANPFEFAKFCLRILPLTVFFFYLAKGFMEKKSVEQETHKIDEKKVQALIQLKQKYSQ